MIANNPLQKYSRTVTLVMLTPKNLKTKWVMRNWHLCVPNKGTYMTNIIIGGGLNTRL